MIKNIMNWIILYFLLLNTWNAIGFNKCYINNIFYFFWIVRMIWEQVHHFLLNFFLEIFFLLIVINQFYN